MTQVTFNYKNHRGEIRERNVRFIAIMFNRTPGYGYQPGWFLHGECLDKNEIRSFALCDIILPDGVRYFILEPQ